MIQIDKAQVVKRVSALVSDIEFETINFGIKLENRGADKERAELLKEKQLLNAEMRGLLSKALNKKPATEDPDLLVEYDLKKNSLDVMPKAVYVSGRYKKLQRGLPQTIWYCRSCRGRGCKDCGYKGKTIDDSVEELVSIPLQAAFNTEKSFFHGQGREDADVRMLGKGRAFVVELSKPKKRHADLEVIQKEINEKNKDRIEITDISFCGKKRIFEVKETPTKKLYSALVEFEKKLTDKQIEKLNQTKDLEIKQETPERVSKRRAIKIRKRTVHSIAAKRVSEKQARLEILSSHGTYIKEFISSDDTRTKPSVSSITRNPAKCLELDVLEIIEQN